jgi:uncharacterized protein
MLNSEVAVFQQNGLGIVFRKADLSLLFVRLDELQDEIFVGDAVKEYSTELERSFIGTLRKTASHADCEPIEKTPSQVGDQRPSLDRFTLTVANVCNLGCSYCYASGGTYYNTKGLMMTRETVLNALNQAARAYSRIEHINFFGGEPTMNRNLIEVACEYTRFLYEKGVLSHLPTFGITTNGYELNDRILELLVGYGFNVTLSLDGPEVIHDLKRPTKTGKGSYKEVSRNAKRLLDCGLEVEFECTFSADHLKMGFTVVSLMDFFHQEFKCHTLHCPIVSASPQSPEFIPLDTCLNLQGDAIEYSLLNLAHGIPNTVSIAVRMLNSLINKAPIGNYCPAGRTEATINADGKIYACFMLMQKQAYNFGTVNRPQDDSTKSPNGIADESGVGSEKDVIESFIADSDKSRNPACQKCWAQPLCHGCLGEDFERYQGHVIRSEIPGISSFCDFKRGLAERFLRSLASAYEVSSQQN